MDSAIMKPRLIHKGAEANLYLSTLGPWQVVIKRRVKKVYRTNELDNRIRRERTAREAISLRDARRSGVRTPSVLDLDIEKNVITMTYIHGVLARDGLDQVGNRRVPRLLHDVGRQIGLLHTGGLVHGDLTTSNIVLAGGETPFLLDFGMSQRSSEAEDMGVDLHLLQRSLTVSHTIDPTSGLRAVSRGYRQAAGEKQAKLSLVKAREIGRRGRYFALR